MDDLVDGLARPVNADTDQLQRLRSAGDDGGTIVGVVGGAEHRLDVIAGTSFRVPPRPPAKKAATLAICQGSRSLRMTRAVLVS